MSEIIDKLQIYFALSVCEIRIDSRNTDSTVPHFWGNPCIEKIFFYRWWVVSRCVRNNVSCSGYELSNNMIIILPVTVISAFCFSEQVQNTKIRAMRRWLYISRLTCGGAIYLWICFRRQIMFRETCAITFWFDINAPPFLTLTCGCAWNFCNSNSCFLIFTIKYLLWHLMKTFASATGTHSNTYNLLIAIITSVDNCSCNEPCRLAADISTYNFPALSAMKGLFKSFRAVIVCSAVISVTAAVIEFWVQLFFYSRRLNNGIGRHYCIFIFSLLGIITGRSKAWNNFLDF